MTDKELLELAAKACGHKIRIYSGMCVDRGTDCVCVTKDGLKWNPLTDDGDALRLAVKLNLHKSIAEAHRLIDDKTDIYAATRRAIVRTAAEIGKTL